MRAGEKSHPVGKAVNLKPSLQKPFDVIGSQGHGKGGLLHRVDTGLADVVSIDVDNVPARASGRNVFHNVIADLHREVIGEPGHVRLEGGTYILGNGTIHDGADQLFPGNASLLGQEQVLGHDHRGIGRLNDQGGAYPVQGDIPVKRFHVFISGHGSSLKPHIGLG